MKPAACLVLAVASVLAVIDADVSAPPNPPGLKSACCQSAFGRQYSHSSCRLALSVELQQSQSSLSVYMQPAGEHAVSGGISFMRTLYLSRSARMHAPPPPTSRSACPRAHCRSHPAVINICCCQAPLCHDPRTSAAPVCDWLYVFLPDVHEQCTYVLGAFVIKLCGPWVCAASRPAHNGVKAHLQEVAEVGSAQPQRRRHCLATCAHAAGRETLTSAHVCASQACRSSNGYNHMVAMCSYTSRRTCCSGRGGRLAV